MMFEDYDFEMNENETLYDEFDYVVVETIDPETQKLIENFNDYD